MKAKLKTLYEEDYLDARKPKSFRIKLTRLRYKKILNEYILEWAFVTNEALSATDAKMAFVYFEEGKIYYKITRVKIFLSSKTREDAIKETVKKANELRDKCVE